MYNIFVKHIEELYNIINEPIDIMYKFIAINNYKNMLGIEQTGDFGSKYYELVNKNKETGIVYTPEEIAKYIIDNTINEGDIINNPFIKIIDPACGTGNIIKPCFKILKQIYIENMDEINYKWNLNLSKDNINSHIIKYNLYGQDVDDFALKVLMIDLFQISKNINPSNIKKADFLIDESEEKFNVFIGNPPYIGHKSIDRQYSSMLKEKYKNVLKDKGDISYCFFQQAINKITKCGKLGFITSRYFLESPSGEELRKVLKDVCSIYKIVDFYGIRPFKNVGIDPVIIFFKRSEINEADIEVIKPFSSKDKVNFCSALFNNEDGNVDKFYINKRELNNKGWILRNEIERNIIKKIEEKSFTNLGNVCNSYQGIITGCDKAFIISSEIIEAESLENEIIKPWIKSSSIKNNKVNKENKYLINTDLIDNIENFPQIHNHILPFKEKLKGRRECEKGIREWYQLQWGRNTSIFENEKIIFPYKANSNRFAMDRGSYFSADIYCLILKEGVPFTYEYLLDILNSKVYEFYFKTFAKKLGEDIYEYYPNNLIKLCIPTMDLIYTNSKLDNEEFNKRLCRYFGFNSIEINIINSASFS